MQRRIVGISRGDMWPGITPFNVGDLTLSLWFALAVSFDEELDQRRRSIRDARRRG